jgi:hypothetical protein
MNVKYLSWRDVDWVHLAVVNTVMNVGVPQKTRNFRAIGLALSNCYIWILEKDGGHSFYLILYFKRVGGTSIKSELRKRHFV